MDVNTEDHSIQEKIKPSSSQQYQCINCGKGFINKRNLIHHQKTHTGEKKFNAKSVINVLLRKEV